MTSEIEKLGMTINKRMQRVAKGNSSIVAEIGVINAAGNLKVPTLQNTIPKSDCVTIKGAEISPGASVLVIWVGNDPIIVGEIEGE